MRMAWWKVAVVSLCLLCLFGCRSPSAPKGQLTFKRFDQTVTTQTLAQLAARTPVETVVTHDPYYKAEKRFRALSVVRLLPGIFGQSLAALRKESFMLLATDGYAVPVAGELLLQDGAYLAIDDVDVPGFAPIGPRKVSPAPSYLIWKGGEELESHPRPWQLSTIAIVKSELQYPHTVPTGEASDSPAMLGYALFRARCIRCHSINREGGSVGPDLNVPQSIVQYRPEPQIRAYIKNPLTFRYGAMPPHPDLTDVQLDQLIAYFHAMSTRPYDPEAKPRHE